MKTGISLGLSQNARWLGPKGANLRVTSGLHLHSHTRVYAVYAHICVYMHTYEQTCTHTYMNTPPHTHPVAGAYTLNKVNNNTDFRIA